MPVLDRSISQRWLGLFKLIPGYDPCADADGCWFDEGEAENAIDFFALCCRHTEGALAGEPFVLEPWQQAVVGCIFGWKMTDDHVREVRRYRRVLIKVGRKNGKTPLVAGICDYILFFDDEPRAQCYLAAYNTEQAGFAFEHAAGFVRQDEFMAERAKIYTGYGQRQIGNTETRGTLKVISAESKGKHGANPHLVVIDEIEMQPDPNLVAAFRTAMVSCNRKQPLMIYIGTADYDRESVANEIFDLADKIRAGIVKDKRFLPVIFEVPRELAFEVTETPDGPREGWRNPELWKLANPNLGVSVSVEGLKELADLAATSPTTLNDFLRFNLNVKTQQVSAWLSMDRWNACSSAVDPVEWRAKAMERLAGKRCFPALDLGSTSDLTALSLLFQEGEKVVVLPFFWIADGSVDNRPEELRESYRSWVRSGFVTPTTGPFTLVTNFAQVRAEIVELSKRFQFVRHEEARKPEFAIDGSFQGDQLCTWLAEDGLHVLKFGQDFASMAAPAKKFEELVISGLLEHGNNPVLRWQASSVCAARDSGGRIKPVKPKGNSPQKVDGIVAAVMSVGRWMARGERSGVSVYEEHGIRTL
jgi:phage terminase large subunit-like protein